MTNPRPQRRQSRLPPALEEIRRRIASSGSTPWHASGRRPRALIRRAYLRALRPYMWRRSEIDLAIVDALQAAETEIDHLRDDIDAAVALAAAADERARRAEGALALHRIDAATEPAGSLDATICTVVSGATIGHAYALAHSAARVHPGTRVIAVITDDATPEGTPPFEVVRLDEVLGASGPHWRATHAGVALEYAVTPWAILHVLDRIAGPAIFVKQESMVVGDMRPLIAELGTASVGLTPHFLAPPRGDDADERTRDVLLAGTFNGGVIVAADTPITRRAMEWWAERLEEECVKEVECGRHFEQRWLDLMHATFDDVVVVRNPGANIGHWNIGDRTITGGPGNLHADGHPIAVLRFSGFDHDQPDVVTRYAPHRLKNGLGPLGDYFAAFRQELVTHQGAET